MADSQVYVEMRFDKEGYDAKINNEFNRDFNFADIN